MQDFIQTAPSLYLNQSFIEDLCRLKDIYTDKLEHLLQYLTLAENSFRQGAELANKFNVIKQQYFNQPNNIDFTSFLSSLKRNIPSWLGVIIRAKGNLESVFVYFQKHVCIPLGLEEVNLSPNPVFEEESIKKLKET